MGERGKKVNWLKELKGYIVTLLHWVCGGAVLLIT
jgi:hypothetical protein